MSLLGLLGTASAILFVIVMWLMRALGIKTKEIEYQSKEIKGSEKAAEIRNEIITKPKEREKVRDKYSAGRPD